MDRGRIVRFARCLVVGAGVALVGTGCIATQTYVDEHDAQVRAALLARVEAVERDALATRNQLTALTGRVGSLETQLTQAVNDARQRADRAQARADEGVAAAQRAQQKADEVDGKLTRALANRFKREQVQEVNLRFAPAKSNLSKEAQAALDGVVKALADNPTYTADVVGYTDPAGGQRYNVTLSWAREESVRRYLVEKGAALDRLFFIGLGEDVSKGKTTAEMAKERHVAVRILRPAN